MVDCDTIRQIGCNSNANATRGKKKKKVLYMEFLRIMWHIHGIFKDYQESSFNNGHNLSLKRFIP